ncbi:MAG: GNAT family N-acetyltransferase [Caldilineaceae bacterium]
MSITYRAVQPHEEDALLRLWMAVLEDSYTNRQQLFGDVSNDPHRFARTQVAISPEGTICGAVTHWLRQIRQTDGTPVSVGHLWGMATDPAYRRRGIATALLDRAMTTMRQEGCQWAVLFAREEARPLYERQGWQGFPTRYRGDFALDNPPESPTYQVSPYDPWQSKAAWQPLAAIYADYNRYRPASLVRTPAYWQGYAAWMARDWVDNQCARYLVVTPVEQPQAICGYALVHFYDQIYAESHFGSPPWFAVSELGVLAAAPGAMTALLAGVVREAKRQQMVYGQFSAPEEPQLAAALQTLFHQPLNREEVTGSLMARPIAPAMTSADLASLFTASGAWLWEVDRY